MSSPTPRLPAVLTRLVWLLWVASLGALAARLWTGGGWRLPGVLAVDGFTIVMWIAVTFFSGVVHSYSRRYMAGGRHVSRFFARLFAFTVTVMVLVAADHVGLFALAWLAMGLVMADLIGHVDGWTQARAARSLARRYFLAGSAVLVATLLALWRATGETTITGIAAEPAPGTVLVFAAGGIVLAAMVQSALIPFHTWLLASMTAPTPASALMHAGFVNAGGILLVRFAPVLTVEPAVMLGVTVIGAVSALGGKLLKSVQTDVKRALGCSTVGQMGFMIMQAGLGFFAAAIAHLILHGCYKAYLFLSAGARVEHTSPAEPGESEASTGPLGTAVTALAAIAGGALFAALTGKGTALDSGLVLTLLVVVTTLHATRGALGHSSLPARLRYGALVVVFLPAITVYAAVYNAISGLMGGLPVVTAPADLTAVHAVVAAAFVLAYVAIERGAHQHSRRLYVWFVNATQPPTGTVLTAPEEYNEY